MAKSREVQTSKGVHGTTSKDILKKMRKDYLASGQRMTNQLKAFQQGKRVVFTVANTGGDTNKRFIKITGEQLFGGEYRKLPTFQLGTKN